MDEEALKDLYDRLLAGQCSQAELRALLDHFEATGADSPLMDRILAELQSQEAVEEPMQRQVQRMLDNTDRALAPIWQPKHRRMVRWLPYAAAAALLVASVVGYFAVVSQKSPVDSLAATEILPGGNKATLTLADGRTIDLSSEQEGIIIGTEDITYTDGSTLAAVMVSEVEPSLQNRRDSSTPLRSAQNDGLMMLSLTTPKGGTYQITLPDGSKVWLNSASTLNYPSRFTDQERLVEIVGEGYFEIEKDTQRPFIVRSEGQGLTVLGTAFNIAAYKDDPETKTTLVEGKVRVDGAVDVGAHNHAPNKSSVILSPGQQSITRGSQLEIREVNTDQYTAWKDGKIALEGRTLPEILKEVSRWYDIEVVYEDQVPQGTFFGRANRSSNLGTVLRLLESAQVGYRLEGRTLFITTKEEVSNLNP